VFVFFFLFALTFLGRFLSRRRSAVRV